MSQEFWSGIAYFLLCNLPLYNKLPQINLIWICHLFPVRTLTRQSYALQVRKQRFAKEEAGEYRFNGNSPDSQNLCSYPLLPPPCVIRERQKKDTERAKLASADGTFVS